MECIAPVTLYRSEHHRIGKEYRTDIVPCGKCPTCLKRRQSGWLFRLEQERQVSKSAAFLTLTYDPKNLPFTSTGEMTLVKSHHQEFIKRLRNNVKIFQENEQESPGSIKYYSCGEYGGKTARPHYHSIIFNLPRVYFENPDLLTLDWKRGHTRIDECTTASMKYVLKYMDKTLWQEKNTKKVEKRIKEFSLMSKGLGLSYLTDERKAYYKSILTPFIIAAGGQKVSMPRYYRDKLYSEEEKFLIQEKTVQYMAENPTWYDEKEKRDYIVNEFNKHQINNQLKRQKL